MHGSASGLIEAFQTYYAGPGSGVPGAADWVCIPAPPAGFFKYGSGGISGCATLCGAPNGACAVLGMIGKGGSPDVLQFYATTSFPTADLCGLTAPWPGTAVPTTPPDPIDDGDVLAHTVSNSPICHASISKWCYAAGVNLASKDAQNRVYKNDRCGKVCAEIAAFAARLINGQTTNGGSYTGAPYYALAPGGYTLPEVTQDCIGCHTKTSDPNIAPAQIGEMQCDSCHTDFMPHEGKQFVLQGLWTERWDGLQWVPQNTFAANDWIRYCMRFHIVAPRAVYVRLKPGTTRAQGYQTPSGYWQQGFFNKAANCSNTVTWYFPDSNGIQVPSDAITKGRFTAQVEVGDTSSGPLLYVSPLEMVYFDVS